MLRLLPGTVPMFWGSVSVVWGAQDGHSPTKPVIPHTQRLNLEKVPASDPLG